MTNADRKSKFPEAHVWRLQLVKACVPGIERDRAITRWRAARRAGGVHASLYFVPSAHI